MSAVARVGDTVKGICNGGGHSVGRPFTGTWVSGSGPTQTNSLATIRVGDPGNTDCGHNFTASTGSGTVTADGLAVHRVGDTVTVIQGGSGTTVSGSSNVSSN